MRYQIVILFLGLSQLDGRGDLVERVNLIGAAAKAFSSEPLGILVLHQELLAEEGVILRDDG